MSYDDITPFPKGTEGSKGRVAAFSMVTVPSLQQATRRKKHTLYGASSRLPQSRRRLEHVEWQFSLRGSRRSASAVETCAQTSRGAIKGPPVHTQVTGVQVKMNQNNHGLPKGKRSTRAITGRYNTREFLKQNEGTCCTHHKEIQQGTMSDGYVSMPWPGEAQKNVVVQAMGKPTKAQKIPR